VVPISTDPQRPLALVTGASTGIGRELARGLVARGYDVVLAANDDTLIDIAAELQRLGASVVAQQVDLATSSGVERLHRAVTEAGRPLDAAALNAGVGASGHFHRMPPEADLEVVDLNVRSVVHLTKLLLPAMVSRGAGRLLFTGSVAGLAPGPYHATYAASKAFVNLFAEALRQELKGTGVTVTALMPGPTDTAFFDRAEMRDTVIGQMPKDDPVKVADQALEAMFAGREHVVSGSIMNRVGALGAGLLPDRVKGHLQAVFTKPREGGR
jgi:short-subunit dehydrogenase